MGMKESCTNAKVALTMLYLRATAYFSTGSQSAEICLALPFDVLEVTSTVEEIKATWTSK
jgi:hypothetical protein